MFQLLRFFASKKSFLFFIFLELISLFLITTANNYAGLKTYDFQIAISGKVNNFFGAFHRFLNYKNQNDLLLKQNSILVQQSLNPDKNLINTTYKQAQFEVIPAYVVSNQYHFNNNIILINKGDKDGVIPEAGVIGTNGIIGIVQNTSSHFSKVVSVLNNNSKISVALKGTNYTGFLRWDGNNPNTFNIIDMPVNAQVKVGDTIITSGMSSVFPKGIIVGSIQEYNIVPGLKTYEIVVKTFMDMTNIGPVYIIKNNYKSEIDSLILVP